MLPVYDITATDPNTLIGSDRALSQFRSRYFTDRSNALLQPALVCPAGRRKFQQCFAFDDDGSLLAFILEKNDTTVSRGFQKCCENLTDMFALLEQVLTRLQKRAKLSGLGNGS